MYFPADLYYLLVSLVWAPLLWILWSFSVVLYYGNKLFRGVSSFIDLFRGYYPCNCRIFSLMTQHAAGVPDTLGVLPTPGILPPCARHSCLVREKVVPPWHMVMAPSPHHQLPQITAAWLCGNVSGQMCASEKSQRGWGCRKWKILDKLMSCCYKWVTKGGFHRVGSVFLWEPFEV